MQARTNNTIPLETSQIPLFSVENPAQGKSTFTTEIKRPNRLKTPQFCQQGTLLKRCTMYVYAEMLEPGKGKKMVRNMVKVKTFSRQYTANGSGFERVRDKVLEEALDFACAYFYELKEKRIRFSRVIVSKESDTRAAQKDRDSFGYSKAVMDDNKVVVSV